ncbi:hypothetical protein GCM10022197_41960 [Microlunatus spumicola]|uniref:HNH endonuclease n=1 Tax=Microlunatus spumicola TaxID=81499 RepID=A0ABP6YBN0_9ACTN
MSKKPADRGLCFCCQKPLTSATVGGDKFTKEHYIPQWLFKRHGLRQQTMDLPSKAEIAYGHLWVPCCEACNGQLNTEIEERARVLITSVPPPWSEEDRQIMKRWLAKVYLGVRVRATTLPLDQKDPTSPTIADQREIDEAVLLRMVVQGLVTVPHSSLFVYECDPNDGDGFDFFSSDVANLVLVRSGSVGLACMVLDGQLIETGMTPAHPLLSEATLGPLNAVSFRMVAAYAMAACAAADVSHDAIYVSGTDGQPRPLSVRFTPHWTSGPPAAQVREMAMAMAETVAADVQWSDFNPPQ